MVSVQTLLGFIVAFAIGYFGYKYLYGSDSSDGYTAQFGSGGDDEGGRDIVSTMNAYNKTVVVFFGSQTGTAEDLASKLAKELSAKLGLASMTADLDNYDLENLDTFPEDHIAVFLMASYGEGEPTDNAVTFVQMISDESVEFSEGESTLNNLHYAVFGLGNSTYELFNKVGRDLFKRLETLGAHSVAAYGEGDDGKDSMEEDFMAWRDDLLAKLKADRGLEEREAVYEPSIAVEPQEDLTIDDTDVFVGEPTAAYLNDANASGPYTQVNPFLAPVVAVKELFADSTRSCIHVEFDISGANGGLRYFTGDHLAFWCQNASEEVDRFLAALGLEDQRDNVIDIKALDKTAHVRIPRPTTYDAVIRHFLEINGAVSRQVLASFAPYAPSEASRAEAKKLAGDKELFHSKVVSHCFNLGRLLLSLSNGQPWTKVPFSLVIETVPHLQPRYYSISSSSLETPDKITITAVVERQKPAGSTHEIRGVATNNILALAKELGATTNVEPLKFRIDGPRGLYKNGSHLRVPVHVRHSNFKLPSKAAAPIVMVGPGTGVAPFRGFVHERAQLAKDGKEVGRSLLFSGSRNELGDNLYADEWPKYSEFLTVYSAFSRDTAEKVYVQHRLLEHAAEVNKLLSEGATFYVCGDASRMARDVNATLLRILQQERSIPAEEAERILRKMKSRVLYQEDVW